MATIAAYAAIVAATRLAKAGTVSGIVTAPIHKEAFAAAGLPSPGHTEILAEQVGGVDVAMMLANEDIRVVLVTIHCALREAIRRADFPGQMAAIRLAHAGARASDIACPRIVVAGLNPHAEESGLPFVWTSPDHGTAFDVAGRGLADPPSLKTAFD